VSLEPFSQKLKWLKLSRALSSREQNTKEEEPSDILSIRIRLSISIEVNVMKTKETMKKMRSKEVKVN
jgi:hypothetical protein